MTHRILMMKLFVVIAVFLAPMLAAAPQNLSWTLEYGTEAGKVGYYNANVNQEFQEASPFGPMAFRIHENEAWVADSCNGRLYCLGTDGKLKTTVQVPDLATDTLLEDFALVTGPDKKVTGIWVGNGNDLMVRHISVADGKELAKFGGNGEAPGSLLQIHQIEVGASGKVYIGDYGKNVIAVFDSAGKFVREQPWQVSGFVLDGAENLYTVSFVDDKGFSIDSFDSAGKALKSVFVGLPKSTNPRIWNRDKDGNFLVSFIPPEGFKGNLDLYQFSPDGKELSKGSVAPLGGAANRFLDVTADGVKYLAEGDYMEAPKGNFSIKTF